MFSTLNVNPFISDNILSLKSNLASFAVTKKSKLSIPATKLKCYKRTSEMIFFFCKKLLKPISVNSFVKVTTISSMKTSRKYRKHFQKQKRCVWIQPSDLHFKNIGAQGYLINESYGHQSARVATYLRTNFYPLSGMCWWSPVSLISRLPGPIDFILTIFAAKKCPFSLAKNWISCAWLLRRTAVL